MNRKKLYLMCGPAGSGKTTWVREHATPGVSAHISRDRIRFKMVKEDEYYFFRENEVYMEFTRQIMKAITCEWVDEVYVDATHLTKKSREKLVREIDNVCRPFDIIVVAIKPSVEQCLAQNAQRSGRELVPEQVIMNMYSSFEDPWDDDLDYEKVIYEGNWYITGEERVDDV
jgi:tRNA uridine 5-carbamoylmethylation protein Kti12